MEEYKLITVCTDHENDPTTYYDVFATHLRSLFPTPRGQYYISAAPLCANTTSLMPYGFYSALDFVFPRFYNARKCNIESAGFTPSFLNWYAFLAGMHTAASPWPKVFIGALSFNNGISGYSPASSFVMAVKWVRGLGCGSVIGGVMLWDGTYGLQRSDYQGLTFNEAAKDAMDGGPVAC